MYSEGSTIYCIWLTSTPIAFKHCIENTSTVHMHTHIMLAHTHIHICTHTHTHTHPHNRQTCLWAQVHIVKQAGLWSSQVNITGNKSLKLTSKTEIAKILLETSHLNLPFKTASLSVHLSLSLSLSLSWRGLGMKMG